MQVAIRFERKSLQGMNATMVLSYRSYQFRVLVSSRSMIIDIISQVPSAWAIPFSFSGLFLSISHSPFLFFLDFFSASLLSPVSVFSLSLVLFPFSLFLSWPSTVTNLVCGPFCFLTHHQSSSEQISCVCRIFEKG